MNVSERLAKIHFPDPFDTISEEDDTLSSRLVDARRSARVLGELPGQLPTTLEQAYGIQAASVKRWPDDVVGWKIARLPPHDRGRFPAERLVGPVFRSFVRSVDFGCSAVGEILDGGFAVIEAEFVLELSHSIAPRRKTWSDADIARHVSRAYCGAEVASSPMPQVIELGATAIISDLGLNTGVIVGPEITGFASLPADAHSVRVSVDGAVVGEAQPGPIVEEPFRALRVLIDHCAVHGIELPRGTLVSTGLLTGAHAVRAGSLARVDFGQFGWFEVSFEQFSRR